MESGLDKQIAELNKNKEIQCDCIFNLSRDIKKIIDDGLSKIKFSERKAKDESNYLSKLTAKVDENVKQKLFKNIFGFKECQKMVESFFEEIYKEIVFEGNLENDLSILNAKLNKKFNEYSKSLSKSSSISSPYTYIFKLCDIFNDPNEISIMHININSLKSQFNKLKTNLLLFERSPDVLCITETKLGSDATWTDFLISGYQVPFYKSRKESGGGGVAIYVKEGFKMESRKEEEFSVFEPKTFESAFVEISTRGFSFICGVVYQNGKSTKSYENLQNSLNTIKQEKKKACICGDFNLDLLDAKSKNFQNFMLLNDFLPFITRPTRYSLNKASLIDHIWVNDPNLVSNSAILADPFHSDHLAICCSLKIGNSLEAHDDSKTNFERLNSEFARTSLNDSKEKYLEDLKAFANVMISILSYFSIKRKNSA